ncbi:hypothetical protein [Streptomyces sp. NPDC048650]|uniref:hypothetical protein n=1 Tax=unclassified Streptomyces TaxID=2593676 RepID=UPI00371781A1
MHRTPRTPRTPCAPWSPRRPKAAVAAAALAAAAVLGTCTTAHAAGPAPTAGQTGHTPYVINHYGEQNADRGRPERSPKHLVLSEHSAIGGIRWTRWGTRKAVGTGNLTGTWCLTTCTTRPLNATVTLSHPRTVRGKKIFSAFTLEPAAKRSAYDTEDLRGTRPLATT